MGQSVDTWQTEADHICFEDPDFGIADCAEMPWELGHAVAAAAADETFDATFDWWFEFLAEDCNLSFLALEQSCHAGIPLPWDMRGVRLAGAPDSALQRLHRFWDACPRHVSAHLAHFVYWLVRAERARRCGTGEWPQAMRPLA